MVDAAVSKAAVRKDVPVQVRMWALRSLGEFYQGIRSTTVYKITDVINAATKDFKATFQFFRSGKLYYIVKDPITGKDLWEFPVDVMDTNDIGGATFTAEFRVITLMRYVHRAIAQGTLVKFP
jgi:hypothetical protein